MSNQNNPTLATLTSNLQDEMTAIYDHQFAQIEALIHKAYNMGLTEGRVMARTEIINLISGDQQ
jgi:hypothetical protein